MSNLDGASVTVTVPTVVSNDEPSSSSLAAAAAAAATTTTTVTTEYLSLPLPELTDDPASWKGRSFISVSQITFGGYQLLQRLTGRMRNAVKTRKIGNNNHKNEDVQKCLMACRHDVLATIFYEPSTRTSCSFQAAMIRLGGGVIHVDAASARAGDGGGSSSVSKGESLNDTIRCLECYVDITVLRHYQQGTLHQVATTAGITKPLINAGDGIGEHPTQALLDLYTILDEIDLDALQQQQQQQDTEKRLVIIMMGDLKHGRTVHSLARLLVRILPQFGIAVDLRYVAPIGLEMPSYIQDELREFSSSREGVRVIQSNSSSVTDEDFRDVRIVYVTRVQKERFLSADDYERVKGSYVIDVDFLTRLPNDNVRILHPLPRLDEISTSCDDDPRAAYFRQMENGLYVRMALIVLLLEGWTIAVQEKSEMRTRTNLAALQGNDEFALVGS